MRFEIDPFVGAGPVRLGMTPAEVTAVLGASEEQEQYEDGLSQEWWFESGATVVYDADGRVEDITILEPGVLEFRGTNLVGMTEPACREFLASVDPDTSNGPEWAMSPTYGIGVQFGPNQEEVDDEEDDPNVVDMASIFTRAKLETF